MQTKDPQARGNMRLRSRLRSLGPLGGLGRSGRKEAKQQQRYCSSCEAEVMPSNAFCTFCGVSLGTRLKGRDDLTHSCHVPLRRLPFVHAPRTAFQEAAKRLKEASSAFRRSDPGMGAWKTWTRRRRRRLITARPERLRESPGLIAS